MSIPSASLFFEQKTDILAILRWINTPDFTCNISETRK